MIKYNNGAVDNRKVVDIKLIGRCWYAVVINDNEFEDVNIEDIELNEGIYGEAIIDATDEEKKNYRKYKNDFKVGDTVKIVSGRKMVGEIKKIVKMFTYSVNETYGHNDTDYLVFEDGTKVNELHCEII